MAGTEPHAWETGRIAAARGRVVQSPLLARLGSLRLVNETGRHTQQIARMEPPLRNRRRSVRKHAPMRRGCGAGITSMRSTGLRLGIAALLAKLADADAPALVG
jgi:hypothetical protein